MTNQPYRGYARPAMRRGRQRRRARTFLLFVAVLAVAVLVLRSRVFVLKNLEVDGNRMYSVQQIAQMAGLSYGESIFDVSSQKVERNLSQQLSVEYISFERQFPDTVKLTIRERETLACVSCGGEYLLIDETGYIMSRSDYYPGGEVLLVSGMDAYIDRQGKRVESAQSGRRTVMCEVIEALREAKLLEKVSELNVSDLDNLYLVSDTGVQVVLGDSQDLPQKLEWMRAVLVKLTEQGVMSGVLDVSTGKNAVYADR